MDANFTTSGFLNRFTDKKNCMLHPDSLKFLVNLKANNSKEWMDANRGAYLAAKADFENFTADMLQVLGKTDPEIAPLQVKDCTFRLNRDIRFSNNKAPYKTNMGWYIVRGGKKSPFAGYYCHIEPGHCFFAGGLWMPMPEVLKQVRQEIDYNFDAFQKILQNKKFKSTFGNFDRSNGMALSRPPKGYEPGNPAIEYLKLKSFVVTTPVDDSLLTNKGLVKHIAGLCETLKPLVDFLNEGLVTEI